MEKNYELLSLLEEDKRFWITNLITGISAIISLIYLLGILNVEIMKEIYNSIPSNTGILKVIYEIIDWPKVNFTAWMIIAFLEIFQLTYVFFGILLNTFFKEYKKDKGIMVITLLTTLYLLIRYRPDWSINYILILSLVIIENIIFLLLMMEKQSEGKKGWIDNTRNTAHKFIYKLVEYKRGINEDEDDKKAISKVIFAIREFIKFGLIISILASLEKPTFEFFKNRLESLMILLLILIIITRWIKPSYNRLNKILSEIERQDYK